MITRNDCILLLAELSSRGINADAYLQKALRTPNVDIEVLKFINENRQLDVTAFYEKLRKSYNSKRSELYINIVKCDEEDCTATVLTTLSALSLQILLFNRNVADSQMFLKHARFEEIHQALLNYSKTYDLVPCIKVLQIIKADLKALEYINR